MGAELVRKYSNIAMRSCYISALRHPFLVVMVFHLIWMYRSFPFLFSLLMYASPVIVSTGILLGTLLFFGHQNVAKIPKPRHHDIHNQKTMVMGDTEIDGSSSCEETHGVTSENAFREKPCVVNNIKINAGKQTDKRGSLIYDSDSKVSTQSRKEAKSEVLLQHSEAKNTKLKIRDKLQGNSSNLLWKCGEKHRDEDNKGWETGSELAESSSPSASMADIFPMLDELHPQVPHNTHMCTDVASDHSIESTDVINDTDDYDDDDDDDDDDQEDIQVKDDEEEEEEEANVDKEDDTTSITWTEDDQKNLMNLGTSEVERNQRLETLIARQKALKNMRIMAEKNMVNLSPDIPFNATLISSSRKNPFDLPYDSNAHILGSVSSVMVPRRNHSEKSDTEGSTFQSDSIPLKPNHPSGRPHERFDVDPSTSVASTQGRQGGFKVGPYSVSERVDPDVTNYSSMNRHKGERNESNVSSTPDTKSTGSADDVEHKNHTKDDSSREANLTCIKEHYHTSKASEHDSQINRSYEDDGTMKLYQVAADGRLDEDKTSVMDEADNQEKSSSNWSSSPLSDVTDHIYDEKEGDKHLESVPETNYFRGPEKSDMQMDISTRHQSPPTRYTEYQHRVVPDNKEQQTTDNESSHHKGTYEDKIISRPHELSLTERIVDKPTRYAEDQNVVVPNNKEQQSTVKASSYHTGTSEEKIISQPKESSLIDRSLDKPAGYVEDQNEVVPDNKEQQSTAKGYSHHKVTSEEKIASQPEELSLTNKSMDKTTRYVSDQNVVVPINKEQQSTSSHHKGTFEEENISQPRELYLTGRSPDKPTRYDEDQNKVVPDNKEQQSTVKTSSHHKDTSEENSVSRLEESSLTDRSVDKPTRYVEDRNEVVPDNKEQQLTVKTSSHHKDTSEENSVSRLEESSLTDRSVDKPTRQVKDQNEVVPDNKEQQSTLNASSHHKDTYEEKISSRPEEYSLMNGSTDKPTRYDEDQNVVVPDNREQDSTVKASSHHNDTSEEKIISQPEELSLTDRSVDKPSRYAEDQHVGVPNNKEEQPTVTSPHHNGTFVEKVIFQPEEMSSEKPLTQDSKELQIQEQWKQISPNNNSTSTTEVKVSTIGTKTPPSPEYSSNMNMIDDDHTDEKIDDISVKSDIGDSSVYESGSDSDTDRSENANTEFASASESEMSRTDEPRFPKRLSQVPQGLTSWLTGWRV